MRLWPLLVAAVAAGCASPRPVPAPSARVAPAPARPAPVVPAWRPRAVVADAKALPARAVVVGPGDTLASVARRAAVYPGAIAAANRLDAARPLPLGAKLVVPAGRWHAVKPGETGLAIARAYGAPWRRIVAANGLVEPFTLEIGDRLLIPPRPVARPLTLEERVRAATLDIDDLITGSEPARVARAPARPVARPATAPAQVAGIRLDWPIEGRILSSFGRKPGGRFNDGVNIAATAGAPVRAAADGTVIYAGTTVAAFGGLVLIRHAGGWVTAYAHNASLSVARGAVVARGQTIATAGATGEVDAPQLHFETRRGRVPVDPLTLLPARDVG